MEEKPYDKYPLCRTCKIELTDDEKVAHIEAGMPALCEYHLIYFKGQLKKCAPLMQKMGLL